MFLLDSSQELDLKNAAYKRVVDLYVWQAYRNDLAKGDITTRSFIPKRRQIVTAKIVAKQSGIFAGLAEAEWFLKKLGIKILKSKKEGAMLKKGDLVMKLQGAADKILAAERTLLNLLQRMSGVATKTFQLRSKLPKSIHLLATRKTLWGDLDKRAVVVGGAVTHRLNLGDAVLIKENHLKLNKDLKKRLRIVLRKSKKIRFIEIELENMKEVDKFVGIFEKLELDKKMRAKWVVMLDNFNPSDIKKAIHVLKKTNVLIEVSGGIDERNIKKYAIKGITAISSGAITNKAPSLDFSLSIT